MKEYRVGIIGATGMVGQRFVTTYRISYHIFRTLSTAFAPFGGFMKKFFCTFFLCMLTAVTLTVSARAGEDIIKVGLYYGDKALYSANLQNDVVIDERREAARKLGGGIGGLLKGRKYLLQTMSKACCPMR